MKLNFETTHAETAHGNGQSILERNASKIEKINNAIKEIEGFEGLVPKPCMKTPEESWNSESSDGLGNPGEYTVDQSILNESFESIPLEKISVIDCREMIGRPIKEVAEYIIAEYGDTHYIPGVEYWEHITKENPVGEVANTWKDGNTHYFLGSTLRDKDGSLSVFDTVWYATSFGQLAMKASVSWDKRSRVTLIKK